MSPTTRRRWHLIDPRCRRGASRGTLHACTPEWIVRAVATLRRMDYCRPGDSLMPYRASRWEPKQPKVQS